MADLASLMWRQAADAWYERDQSAAASLARLRDEMTDLHAALTAEAAANMNVRDGNGDGAARTRLRAPGRPRA
jgi:phosphate uptake regulator